MYSKSLLIAIAAFAVTASGAQAFMGVNYAQRAGLSPTQTEAFSQARELRLKGRSDEARDVLLAAGIDEKTLGSLRHAAHSAHTAIHEAVEAGDFAAFKVAVADMPLSDIITTEADFETFSEAYRLRQSGEYSAAAALYTGLGITHHRSGRHPYKTINDSLTAEQRDALMVAKQNNDRATVKQILEEAGLEETHKRGHKSGHHPY